jgi:hypothetical protein
MKVFLTSAAIFAATAALPVRAETVAMAEASSSPPAVAAHDKVDVTASAPFTIGYVSPAFGAVTLGVSPQNPLVAAPVNGSAALGNSDFSATYKTELYGSQFGVSAGFANGGGSLFTAEPTPGWSFGASVGYAGFYVHAGISDATQARLNSDPGKGWLAGFGYETGALNLRFSYMTAQSLATNDGDSRTWMIGGIYRLNSRIRLNADAFTNRDLRTFTTPAAAAAAASAPQGTGARVGVQLRF